MDDQVSGNAIGPKQIFKPVKNNLPKDLPPKALQIFLDSVHDDVLYSPLNKVSPNLTKEQQAAIDLLVSAQRRREITVKPNDKCGGSSILNLQDYIEACNGHLFDTFPDEHGHEQPLYRHDVPEPVLKLHWAQVKDLVNEGVECGHIHPDDVPHLVPPQPKPGRFYGLVKNHVEPEQRTGPIPPLRPIVSASGSNTEGISHLVDEYSRGEVKKLDS